VIVTDVRPRSAAAAGVAGLRGAAGGSAGRILACRRPSAPPTPVGARFTRAVRCGGVPRRINGRPARCRAG